MKRLKDEYMGKIFCVMGKSSSGKDTLYKMLLKHDTLQLSKVVLYATRPIRTGEKDGREYFFVDEARLEELEAAGKVIEKRVYQTMHGPWIYFTVDDGQISLAKKDYLMIATLESYSALRKYFGEDAVVPIYIEVEDGVRLQRALDREKAEENPKYAEMCRRFLADAEDFSEEKLKMAGVDRRFINEAIEDTCEEIVNYIQGNI